MKQRNEFGEKVTVLSEPVYRFMVSRGMRPEDASDLTQETMLRAFRSQGKLRNPKRLRGWVFGIARHVMLDAHRKRYRHSQVPLPAEEVADTTTDPGYSSR